MIVWLSKKESKDDTKEFDIYKMAWTLLRSTPALVPVCQNASDLQTKWESHYNLVKTSGIMQIRYLLQLCSDF